MKAGEQRCSVPHIGARLGRSLILLALLLSLSTVALAKDPDCGTSAPSGDGETLSLDRALDLALSNNPEIAATTWEVEAAKEKLSGAKAARWLILSADALYQRNMDDQRLVQARYNGEPGIFDDDILRADVVLKIPLYSGGKITSEIDTAELLHLAEEKRLARTREELIFSVASTYFVMLGQHGVIQAVERSIDSVEGQSGSVVYFSIVCFLFKGVISGKLTRCHENITN